MTTETMQKGAYFSDCRRYRYFLYRIWDTAKPLIMFIGLNPSTADEHGDDPTIKRVIDIAKSNGAGGIYMCNLYAYVTPYPRELHRDYNLQQNDDHLKYVATLCDQVVFAWGNFRDIEPRTDFVKSLFPNARALHINKNGSPKHPLYCRKDSPLITYPKEVSHA